MRISTLARLGCWNATMLCVLWTPKVGIAASDAASKPAPRDIVDLDITSLLQAPVEVGGFGESRRVLEVPAVVDVLDAEDIERLGVRDIRELLVTLLGAYELGNPSAELLMGSVFLRGGPSGNRFLLLLDDLILNDAANESYAAYALPVAAIERVELLRGPAAVLYGSSAMAGVIRVVTKDTERPSAGVRAGVNRLAVTQSARVGDVAAYGTAAPMIGGERLRVRADLQARRTQDARLSFRTPEGVGTHRDQHANASAMLTARYGAVFARLLWHGLEGYVAGFEPLPSPVPPALSRGTLWAAEMGFEAQRAGWHLDWRLDASTRWQRTGIGSFPRAIQGPSTDFFLKQRIVRTGARASRSLREGVELALGAQYRYSRAYDVRFTDRATGDENPLSPISGLATDGHEVGLLGQVEISLGETLKLIPAARIGCYGARGQNLQSLGDADAKVPFQVHPLWRMAVLWTPHAATAVKALLGRAYRVPNMAELFPDMPPFAIPNLELKPELQDTFELALDASAWPGWTFRTSAFANVFSNAIANKVIEQRRFVNLDEALVVVGGTARVERRSERLVARWGVSLQACRSGSSCSEHPLPGLMAAASFSWRVPALPGFELSPHLRYRNGFGNSGEAYDLSATATWKILPWLRVGLTGMNISNHPQPRPYGAAPFYEAKRRRSRTVQMSVSVDHAS